MNEENGSEDEHNHTNRCQICLHVGRLTLPITCGGPSDQRERRPASGEVACY